MSDEQLLEMLEEIKALTQGIVDDFNNKGFEIHLNGDDQAHRKLMREKLPFEVLNAFVQKITPIEFHRISKKKYRWTKHKKYAAIRTTNTPLLCDNDANHHDSDELPKK